ncbi:orotidine 5'-phosphate decarboxylase [Candidatus Parcubacteria bacterium]|nr:orotidine 5'-phosphate decarboxylase [Candidatus Parcubacteria bacterium]
MARAKGVRTGERGRDKMKPCLFIALDGLSNNEKETLKIAEKLSNVEGNFGFKINLDYLLKVGTKKAIEKIRKFGRPIFADIKMFNGTRTMKDIIRDLVDLEVEYLNVYALADYLLPEAVAIAKGTKTKVLCLTILTHFDDSYCQNHYRRSLKDAVRHFAKIGKDANCDGVILPGTMLEVVKDLDMINLVPGVRPEGFVDDRHKEEINEGDAIDGGADILVIGGPIMNSENPVNTLSRSLYEIKKGEQRR